MEIDQELLGYLIKKIKEKTGFEVYPTIPDASAPYPFVAIGEIQIIPSRTKDKLLGVISVRVDVWGKKNHRVEVSEIIGKIRALSSEIPLNYRILTYKSDNSRVMEDRSTSDLLWHGIIFLELAIN